LIVAGAVTAVGVSSLAGFSAVSAQSSTGTDNLIDKIATKFNLNKADVQKLFDEDRTAHEAQQAKQQSARLQKLVDAGTITAQQKTVIEAKVAELKAQREANRDSMKDLTGDQRKAKMDEERASLEAWAKQQGLDLTKLKGVFMGGMGGPGGRHGMPPTDADTSQ